MDSDNLINELVFKAVRSSGPGGQNVNKVASKVVLSFDLMRSIAFSEEEKTLLRTQLSSKLTNEEQLLLTCDEDRSQIKNKEIIIKRFLALITKALVVPKIRKPTKIPRSVIEKRLKAKANNAWIKQNRKKPSL
jgi:ribosome-associated protein